MTALKSKTLGQVTERKAISLYGMEELALRQATLKKLSGGVLYARTTERTNKDEARQRILNLFAPKNWPGRLHMFTMPGLHWRFERLLLGAREPGWMRRPQPRGTFFTSVENDRAIYFASVGQMPGLHTPEGTLKQITKYSSFAEMGVKTRYGSFFFANIDDLMKADCWTGWDAAWLDYTGQTSVRQMALIKMFYEKYVRSILILTTMRSRWQRQTSDAISAAGGYSNFLRNHLIGDVLHDLEYSDTAAMSQFAVRKPNRTGALKSVDSSGGQG